MGWGKGDPQHCTSLVGYQQAQRYFESRKPVRSKRWKANERPLVTSTETWFMLIQGENASYYDVQYGWGGPHTIRYYAPDGNGDYRVLLGASRAWRNTWDFLRVHGWRTWYSPLITTAGQHVHVPLSTERVLKPYGMVPEGWSASLTFNKDGKLILGKSDHRPIFTRISTDEDKRKRKLAREAFDPALDVLMLRLPTFHQDSNISALRRGAFGGHQDEDSRKAVRTVVDEVADGSELSDDVLQHLLPYAQEVYNVCLSNVVPDHDYEDQKTFNSAFPGFYGWRTEGANGAALEPVSEGTFRKALRAALIRHASVGQPSGLKELAKFSEEKLPSKYTF